MLLLIVSLSYTHYVFQTLTYNREDISSRRCRHLRWWWISRDVTAYIQRIRRRYQPLGPIEFLRVIERHKDYEPHVHLLLHFQGALRVDNGKFFDRQFFDDLQRQWKFGFDKPEVLRKPDAAFSYALKYFLKQISDQTVSDSTGDVAGISDSEPQDVELPPKIWPLRGKRLTFFGMPIRLLAWSRGMQYLYKRQQYESLLRKGFKVDPPTKLVLRTNGKQTIL